MSLLQNIVKIIVLALLFRFCYGIIKEMLQEFE